MHYPEECAKLGFGDTVQGQGVLVAGALVAERVVDGWELERVGKRGVLLLEMFASDFEEHILDLRTEEVSGCLVSRTDPLTRNTMSLQ